MLQHQTLADGSKGFSPWTQMHGAMDARARWHMRSVPWAVQQAGRKPSCQLGAHAESVAVLAVSVATYAATSPRPDFELTQGSGPWSSHVTPPLLPT